MPDLVYSNNSDEKDAVRTNWIAFSREVLPQNDEHQFKLLTLPSFEMQDLFEYSRSGLIELTPTETEAWQVTKGKVFCVEKSAPKFEKLSKKLTYVKSECGQVCTILNSQEWEKFFPFDTFNLDFDGRLNGSMPNPEDFLNRLFNKQANHRKTFSFYITFPEASGEENAYIDNLRDVINAELNDASSNQFNTEFQSHFRDINSVPIEELYKMSITKLIIKCGMHYRFKVKKAKFFAYGHSDAASTGEHRRMIALLYILEYNQNEIPPIAYYHEIMKVFDPITDLSVPVEHANTPLTVSRFIKLPIYLLKQIEYLSFSII